MTEILTWSNALQMLLGLVVMLGVYTIGVAIGATLKWINETFIHPPGDEPSDSSEPPIPTSTH
jgi:hypothetical protein